MRWTIAGLVLLAFATTALAQVEGEVESIGFQGYFRPNCWTPMVVRLKAKAGDVATYQIQVVQEDLDRDRAAFARPAVMEGAREGQSSLEKRFFVYFIPQPTEGGLVDTTRLGLNLKDLQAQLKVFLCTQDGKKQLRILPVTQMPTTLDPVAGPFAPDRRGTRCILCVTDGPGQPVWREYQNAVGIDENVIMLSVQARDLPENVLGYDAIDGILWINADMSSPSIREDKLPALQAYVRQGGRLVICQTLEWRKTLAFGNMLPVTISGMEDKADLQPLKSLAGATASANDPWNRIPGPFKVARAEAKANARVVDWVVWNSKPTVDRTPYLVRGSYGMGSVTWVAQDLADPAITGTAKNGWPLVWDHVFDWRNQTVIATKFTPDVVVKPYAPSDYAVDVGSAMLNPMKHGAKSASLVLLAIAFFAVYWLVSGPGAYLFLGTRRRPHLNWFAFAAAAVAATLLTMLVVKLVLRGPPQVRHVTVVRTAPGVPTVETSFMGVYIPRDGEQVFQLQEMAPGAVGYITAFPRHPQQERGADNEFPAYMDYAVPLHDPDSSDPIAVRIPYRSTLKKLQARWVGDSADGIGGSASLVPGLPGIQGRLVNKTGNTLRNVYFVHTYPPMSNSKRWQDHVLYLPQWEKDASIDLEREFQMSPEGAKRAYPIGPNSDEAVPGDNKSVYGIMELTDVPFDSAQRAGMEGWVGYWYGRMPRARLGESEMLVDDLGSAFPMMSLFDHLPPSRNPKEQPTRVELLRRGARQLDMSHVVSAGQLLVLAEASGPLPMPLEIEGSRPEDSQGTILYQCVVPLDRSAIENPPAPATTRPTGGVP